MQTRRASRATTRPSTVIESSSTGPCFGTRHCSFPVSISTASAVEVTFTGTAGAGPVPGAMRRAPALATAANPTNLREPSGQVASGHVCTGTGVPSAVSCSGWSRRTAPFANGTPQLTPTASGGAAPPSQLIATSRTAGAPACCAEAACSTLAAAVLARISRAERRVIFM